MSSFGRGWVVQKLVNFDIRSVCETVVSFVYVRVIFQLCKVEGNNLHLGHATEYVVMEEGVTKDGGGVICIWCSG